MNYLLLICVGCIAGLFSSLFGLGGGLTIVPALVFTLPLFGFPSVVTMHVAIGTALSIMFFNSLNAVKIYYHHNSLDPRLIWSFIPFLLIGTLLGSLIVSWVPGKYLMLAFLSFMLIVISRCIVKLLFSKTQNNKSIEHQLNLPVIKRAMYGTLTGVISACTGGGSSLVIVPLLKHAGFSIKYATSVANSLNIIIALIASVSYAYLGHYTLTQTPPFTTGFIYWPAFMLIILGSLAGVPIGAYISRKMAENVSEKLFLVVLIIIFILMCHKILQG